MPMRRPLRFLLLIAALVVVPVHAQEAEQQAPPDPPDLNNLQSSTWDYFEPIGPEDDLAARVETFLAQIETELASLRSTNQEVGQSIFAAIRENFGTYLSLLDEYLSLLDEGAEEARRLEPAQESYTVDDLLQAAAESREARADAEQQQIEVDREQRILDGIRQRRDLAFKRYLETAPGDEKLLAGLRLIQDRSALAIARLRVRLLTSRSEQAFSYAAAAEERVELASKLLPKTISDEAFAQLQENVSKAEAAVEEAEQGLQQAEISASRLSLDTPEGRSQQRLDRQKLIDAQVADALARLQYMKANTLLIWAEILLGSARDRQELQQLSLGAREFVRDVGGRVQEWRADTQDEVFAVQTVSRDGLNRSARRLLDQRLGTAQATVTHIEELQAAAEELGLLSIVAEDAYVENVGAFRSFLAISERFFRGFAQRVKGIADTTLFELNDTPVAGSDLLRVIIILVIAFVFSRLVRHAITRFSSSQDAGTQASLYTVGRLGHYTIITIALIFALSTIGLDFSNLAIVAGALGVGIGFGLQSIVGNFVSGLIILFEHSLRVGDYIELDNGLTGIVKSINVRSTLITTNDNIDIVVPNSEFVNFRLTNWTLGERIRRVRVPFNVAYGSDKEVVKQAALEAADEVPYTLSHMRGREIQVRLVEFGDSSLNFLMLVWVNRQGAMRPGRTIGAYLWALEGKLREHGIEVPFPQRDLHLRSGWKDPEQPLADLEEPDELPEPAA